MRCVGQVSQEPVIRMARFRTGDSSVRKRLEQGRFVADWTKVATRQMDWTGLKMLLEGIEANVVRKRYQPPRRVDANGIIAA